MNKEKIRRIIESGKIMFAMVGVGTATANAVTAGRLFFVPVIVVFAGAWYALYTHVVE